MTTKTRFIQTTDYLSIALAMALSVLGYVKDIFAARPTKASAPTEHLRIAIMVEVTTSSTQCRLMELTSSPSSDSTLSEISSECYSSMQGSKRKCYA